MKSIRRLIGTWQTRQNPSQPGLRRRLGLCAHDFIAVYFLENFSVNFSVSQERREVEDFS